MSRSRVRWLLLLILLLGWGLRLWRLDYQELRGDEVFGYFFSLRPFDDMVQATVDLQEPHPVASYVVQQEWLGWAGHSEFALRFSSVWFGLLAVVLLWRLAQALTLPTTTALLATLLLAISPYAVWHSQDARMYSMSLALHLVDDWLVTTPTAFLGHCLYRGQLVGAPYPLFQRLCAGGAEFVCRHAAVSHPRSKDFSLFSRRRKTKVFTTIIRTLYFDQLVDFAGDDCLFLWAVVIAGAGDADQLSWQWRFAGHGRYGAPRR